MFLGLLAISVFFAREALFGGRAFFLRDLHLQWFGQVESFVHAVAAGSWPLWDPYVSFGQPMLANANVQVLYPLTWLNFLMRPYWYYTLYFLFHLVLAGTGTTALARQWGASEAGAFVAGALWIASGPFLSLGNLWNHLAGAAWMPWTLVAADRALAGSRRGIAGWALAIAATILAGSPDFALLAMVPVTALLIERLDWKSPAGQQNRRVVVAALFAIVVGVGIAAAQVFPSVELARHSIRWTMSAESRTYWSAHPAALAQMLVPMSWDALPWSAPLRAILFESREPYLLSAYLGLPVMALAACALATNRVPRRIALGLSAAVCVALALGNHTPVYSAAVGLLPVLRSVRYPVKALVPAALCITLLCGFGFDSWRARTTWMGAVVAGAVALLVGGVMLVVSNEWPDTVASLLQVPANASTRDVLTPAVHAGIRLGALGAATLVLAIASRRSPWAAGTTAWLLAGLALADLAALHGGLNPTAPTEMFRWRPDALKAVEQTDGRRLFVYDYNVQPGVSRRHLGREVAYLMGASPERERWRGAAGMRAYPVPPVGAAYGIFDSFGRDLLGVQPLPLARLNAAFFATEGTAGFHRLLRIGAVSQVLCLHDDGMEELTPDRRWRGPFFEDIRLFRVPDPLPRFFVAGRSRVGDIDTLLDPAFDPTAEVVLSEPAPLLAPSGSRYQVRLVEARADRLRLEVDGEAPGLLVFVDAYDAGWVGRVDGVPAPVLRANVAFRALPVPGGRHVVEMVYRPLSVILGAVTSVVSVLGLALWSRH